MEPWMRRMEEMRKRVVKQNRREALLRKMEELLERHFKNLEKIEKESERTGNEMSRSSIISAVADSKTSTERLKTPIQINEGETKKVDQYSEISSAKGQTTMENKSSLGASLVEGSRSIKACSEDDKITETVMWKRGEPASTHKGWIDSGVDNPPPPDDPPQPPDSSVPSHEQQPKPLHETSPSHELPVEQPDLFMNLKDGGSLATAAAFSFSLSLAAISSWEPSDNNLTSEPLLPPKPPDRILPTMPSQLFDFINLQETTLQQSDSYTADLLTALKDHHNGPLTHLAESQANSCSLDLHRSLNAQSAPLKFCTSSSPSSQPLALCTTSQARSAPLDNQRSPKDPSLPLIASHSCDKERSFCDLMGQAHLRRKGKWTIKQENTIVSRAKGELGSFIILLGQNEFTKGRMNECLFGFPLKTHKRPFPPENGISIVFDFWFDSVCQNEFGSKRRLIWKDIPCYFSFLRSPLARNLNDYKYFTPQFALLDNFFSLDIRKKNPFSFSHATGFMSLMVSCTPLHRAK